MGVHPEEETNGVESLGSMAGAAVLGDGRKRQWGEVEGCDDGAHCAWLGFGDLTNLPPQPAGSAAAATVNGSRESTGVETTNVHTCIWHPDISIPGTCVNHIINPHRVFPTTQKKGVLPWCRGWLGLVI